MPYPGAANGYSAGRFTTFGHGSNLSLAISVNESARLLSGRGCSDAMEEGIERAVHG